MTLNRTAFHALIAAFGLTLHTTVHGNALPAVTGTALNCAQFRALFTSAAQTGDRAAATLAKTAQAADLASRAAVVYFPGCTWSD